VHTIVFMTGHALITRALLVGASLSIGALVDMPRADAYTRQAVRVAREAVRVQDEAARITGRRIPIDLVPSRTINAYATKRRVGLHTALPGDVVKGAAFHEIGHVLLGHNGWRAYLGVRRAEREADFAAGFLLAQSGHAFGRYARAYLRLMKQAGDPDHGTPAQRVAATLDGIVEGLSYR
jgi:hypothetical protein